MPWTLERAEPARGAIIWLELDRNEEFVMEQKLKDVSSVTPTSSLSLPNITKKQRKRSGSFSSFQSSRYPSEAERYKFQPMYFPENLIQFRIRTRLAGIDSSFLVIAVACSHASIQENWQTVIKDILPNIKAAGLDDTQSSVNFSKRRWFDFILFQVSSLAGSQISSEFDQNVTQHNGRHHHRLSFGRDLVSMRDQKRSQRPSFVAQSDEITINQARRSSFVYSENQKMITQDKLQVLLDKSMSMERINDENILHSVKCVIVSRGSKFRMQQYHLGMLILTSTYLAFYRKDYTLGKNEKLFLDLTDIESITLKEKTDDLPSSLNILHNARVQFHFIGIPESCILLQKLELLWKQLLTEQQKALKRRLKQQTFVYTTEEQASNLPNIKLLSFFSKKKNQNIAIVPTTTKLPLFSLAPFVQASATCEKCTFIIESHLEFPISGSFYLTIAGGTFVSKKHSIMFSMPHSIVESITYAYDAANETPNVEVSLHQFGFPINLYNLSQKLSDRWMKEWFAVRDETAAKEIMYYSSFSDEHEICEEIVHLKQRYLEQHIRDVTELQLLLWEQYTTLFAKSYFRTDILQRLIYIGIPNSMRGRWWCTLVGVNEKKKAIDEVSYGYMISQFGDKDSIATLEISRDAHRSLPEHDYYTEEHGGCETLSSVLRAYSWRNSSIGYCQSMNLVCALLLLYMSEEDAYTVLCVICGKLIYFIVNF